MQLDAALIERLKHPMWVTWNAIGYDIIEACGENLTNEVAVECCIDANRLSLNGNDSEADEIVRIACADHGYEETLQFLCQHFKYA